MIGLETSLKDAILYVQRTYKMRILILLLFPLFLFSQEIDDTLQNETSGKMFGGQLTDTGWKTTSNSDFIEWLVPTCPQGKIEFDVTGLYANNDVFPNLNLSGTGESVHYNFMCMFDADTLDEWFGQTIDGIKQWHNPYKMQMHLFGYVLGDMYKWRFGRFRLNVSAFSGGYDDDPHAFENMYGPVQWNGDKVYHIVLEWGNGHMTYKIDGIPMTDCDYSTFGAEYAPPQHILRLGSARDKNGAYSSKGVIKMQVPVGITFSNFKFYRLQDETPPQVVRHHVDENRLDPYIAITMDESIKYESIGFEIEPYVEGNIELNGNTISYELNSPLQEDTQYRVALHAVSDNAGNWLQESYVFTFRSFHSYNVSLYQPFEVISDVPGIINFHGPNQTIKVKSFDCGNYYKYRMAPTETGTWLYNIGDQVKSFQCVPGSDYHILTDSTKFVTTGYEQWLWLGDTSWRAFTSLLPLEGRYKEYVDLRAEQGYTSIQSIVVSYINGDAFW